MELLLELLQKKVVGKDSHNSSLPPSGDLFTKNKSLRPVYQCPTCQHQQLANFPLGVNAPIQYGSTV